MSSLCFAAWALWQLGYPDQALKSSQAAVSLAREVAHPFSVAYALDFTAWCHQLRREGQKTKEQAEAMIALSTEQGFPMWAAQGTVLRGWALVVQGQVEEGIALPTGPAGESAYGHIFLPCWPTRMGRWGRPKKG